MPIDSFKNLTHTTSSLLPSFILYPLSLSLSPTFPKSINSMSNDHLTVETTAAGGEFMLFGVRVVVDSMRKSVSLNNLSQYQHHLDSPPDVDLATGNVAGGYASADEAAHRSSAVTATASAINRERKRGVPWTEEEHKLFLLGLQKVGKGDWRGISRTFVKTRTPTQVASHAQKYFLRRSNLNRRRRRSSLFDITTADSVAANSSNDQIMSTENKIRRVENQPQQSKFEISNVQFTISPTPICNDQLTAGSAARAVESPGSSSSNSKSMFDFNLNTNTNTDTNTSAMSFDSSPLSLNLSLSMFPQRFDSRDGVISVA